MITRKQLRLKGYDYRQENAYFITICCHQNRHLFGHVAGEQMHLNAYGQFAHDQWLTLPDTYPHIALGEFVIMPNHMHGTIYVGKWDYGADGGDGARPTISDIIGAYKSLTYRDCLALAKETNERLGKLWLRSFYEIIIRTPDAAKRIRHYIRYNVRTWVRDKFYGG